MLARRGAIRTLAAGLCAALLSTGCSNNNKDDDVLRLTDDGPGTCLDVPDTLGETVSKLPKADCEQPHTHEIYSVVNYDRGDVFPGLEALDRFAQEVCVRDFEPYVGISSFDSTLTFTWLTPTLASWNNHKDRAVLCVLTDFAAAKLTGSMKGTKK